MGIIRSNKKRKFKRKHFLIYISNKIIDCSLSSNSAKFMAIRIISTNIIKLIIISMEETLGSINKI